MVFNTTEQLQGHNGVVHGGLIATLLDNCYSYLSASATGIFPQNPINIHINYRKPIKFKT